MRFLRHHVYMVSDPERIFDVLVTDNRKFMKGQATQEAKRLLGEGLFTSDGDLHRRQRKLLQPVFHPVHLHRQGEIAVECAGRLGRKWADGETIDVGDTMRRVTLEILGKAILDYDLVPHLRTFADASEAAVAMVEKVLRPWAPRLRSCRCRPHAGSGATGRSSSPSSTTSSPGDGPPSATATSSR